MRKNILVTCVLLAVALSLNACLNDEIKTGSFKDLCEMSGGEVKKNGINICLCGIDNEGIAREECDVGVVCSAGGQSCLQKELPVGTCVENTLPVCVGQKQAMCKKMDIKDDFEWIHQDCLNDGKTVSCREDGENCGECINGKRSCTVDNVIQICENGIWVISPEDYVCKDTLDGSLYTGCMEGEYVQNVVCLSAENQKVSCANYSCGECMNGEFRCLGDLIEECVNGRWRGGDGEFVCKDIYHETYEKGYFTRCINGEFVRDAKCLNDNGVHVSCATDYSCGDCLNGEYKCNENSIEVCENGKWNVKDGEFVCKNSYNGSDVTGSLTRCINGEFVRDADCLDSEGNKHVSCATSYTCGECVNGDIKCEQGNVKTNINAKVSECRNGVWSVISYCNTAFCSEQNTCALWPTGKCIAEDSSVCFDSVLAECKNEDGEFLWKKRECRNEDGELLSCNKLNTECGECMNESIQCSNENGIGIKKVCQLGTWSESIQCVNNNLCVNNSCGECASGETKCEYGVYSKCLSGNWMSSDCKFGCSNEYICNECQDNDTKCENGVLEVCENGSWKLAKKCEEGEFCDSLGEKCVKSDNNICNAGEVRCVTIDNSNAKLESCYDGKWEFSSYCESGKCEDDNKPYCKALPCIHGTIKCENDYVHECNFGTWNQTNNKCNDEETCTYGTVLSCVNSWNGNGAQLVCNDIGMYVEQSCYDVTRTYITSCKSEKECGECLSGWYYYPAPDYADNEEKDCTIKSKSKLCVDGTWKNITEDIHCKTSCVNKDRYIRCNNI